MEVEAAFGLSRIGQIAIPVHDVDNAVKFYRDALGIEFLYQFPGLAFFDCAGVRLMLSRPETPEFDRPGSVLYFQVENLAAVFDVLSERGVEFMDDPHLVARMEDHDLWMAFFKDIDGNVLALMSQVRTR